MKYHLSERRKTKRNEREIERRNLDPFYKFSQNLRSSMTFGLKNGFTEKSKTYKILGCSFDEFRLHIESKFEIWMNWSNYGKYTGTYNETWQYDHIIPTSSAKNEDDLIKLNHYTNLQPLCSKKNASDKNRHLNYNIYNNESLF